MERLGGEAEAEAGREGEGTGPKGRMGRGEDDWRDNGSVKKNVLSNDCLEERWQQ